MTLTYQAFSIPFDTQGTAGLLELEDVSVDVEGNLLVGVCEVQDDANTGEITTQGVMFDDSIGAGETKLLITLSRAASDIIPKNPSHSHCAMLVLFENFASLFTTKISF